MAKIYPGQLEPNVWLTLQGAFVIRMLQRAAKRLPYLQYSDREMAHIGEYARMCSKRYRRMFGGGANG